MQLRVRNLTLRAEYEKLDTDIIDLDLISLGAMYSFEVSGSSAKPRDTDVLQGLYVGAAISRGHWDERVFDRDTFCGGTGCKALNDRYEEGGWKATAGWRLHDNFATEVSYVDFGDLAVSVPVGFDRHRSLYARADGFSAFAVGLVPIPYVDFFAKAGVAYIDWKSNFDTLRLRLPDQNTTKFAYGAGVQLRYRNIAIRAEYENFDTETSSGETDLSEMDLEQVSLGVTYTFDLSH